MNSTYLRINRSMLFLGVIFPFFFAIGCNKLVEVEASPVYTTSDKAYASDANAISVLNGIYANMSAMDFATGASLNTFATYYAGLSADEFTVFDGVTNVSIVSYYQNNLNPSEGPNIWTNVYQSLYRINDAVLGVSNSKNLTSIVQKQLLGEAKFLRAFSYFYLVNFYGPVPLVLTTDYKVNAILPRSPVNDIYKQIVTDLQAADTLLSADYVGKDGYSSSSERIVPTKWAAKSLLARTYLFLKDYQQASIYSTQVLENNGMFELAELNDVFHKNSQEAIWQLQPVNTGWNTEDARLFIIPETGPSDIHPIFLSNDLLNSFENNDQRRVDWIDTTTANGVSYYYPYKYKSATVNEPVTEYQMVLRLAEQYLIRAESKAQLNLLNEAIGDLNVIRNRANLPDYSGGNTQVSILSAIYQERRVEFFSEWGHRWLDLKRTSNVDNVMTNATQVKGGRWSSYKQYFPIPAIDVMTNINLTQNDGY